MKALLTMKRDGDAIVPDTSLDALWAQAEAIGRVSVDSRIGGGYRSTICYADGGSSIFAHGEGRTAADALSDCIREVRRLAR